MLLSAIPAAAQTGKTHGPDCAGGWPTNMAQAALKNAGILKNEDIDFSKTKTVRLASEQLQKDLWRQVYVVTFIKKSGEVLQAIAVHNASSEECSITEVQVFVVSKKLN
jgi:hypothetical protein